MSLQEIIQSIRPADPAAAQAARRRWDSLAKPLGSLGVLEENIVKIAALTRNESVCLDRRRLLVFCADNGVIRQGVSQSDASVTAAVAAALGKGTSTVNYMADRAAIPVVPVDIGMRAHTPAGVRDCKIRSGTADITQGPAMTRPECERAIALGAELAGHCAGDHILLLGEMGIGNTTTAAAVACVLLDRTPEALVGRGAGLSDLALTKKVEAVREAIRVNRPDPADPIAVLQTVGGLDLAALCGVCLGAAACRIPVLLDGVITNAAALCAVRLCPAARDALLASHVSAEPAAALLLDVLGIRPCISAGLHLGEGSGAVLALSLLEQALTVYNSGHTFDALGIPAYTKQTANGGKTCLP